jgi:hypothetical protein
MIPAVAQPTRKPRSGKARRRRLAIRRCACDEEGTEHKITPVDEVPVSEHFGRDVVFRRDPAGQRLGLHGGVHQQAREHVQRVLARIT